MFKIFLVDPADLLHNNANYFLGWYELTYNNQHVAFFKAKSCMVVLTLTSLLDHLVVLKSKQTNAIWIGEDNGIAVEFNRDKSILNIRHDEVLLKINFDAFSYSVIEETERFTEECTAHHSSVINSGAFYDLRAALLNTKQLLFK